MELFIVAIAAVLVLNVIWASTPDNVQDAVNSELDKVSYGTIVVLIAIGVAVCVTVIAVTGLWQSYAGVAVGQLLSSFVFPRMWQATPSSFKRWLLGDKTS